MKDLANFILAVAGVLMSFIGLRTSDDDKIVWMILIVPQCIIAMVLFARIP